MKYPKKLLPAVMLSASVLSSLTGTVVMANGSAISVQANTDAGLMPAVFSSRLPSNYPVPERLTKYTTSMAEQAAFPAYNSDGELIASCATISGSDNGWGDTDCMN